ncbi:MAG: glycerophosphodiester phosphodiesterase [Rhodoferax sp.]|nr:glycerophosphodiester phosphodiesterase [Rhodoferax sp.]
MKLCALRQVVLGTAGLLLALAAQAFDLQSHRGGRGLWPENTLAAFTQSIQLGVTTLELDIGITADGVPVITHDQALNPGLTRDARGDWIARAEPLIKDMTLAQVQSYDVGRLNPRHAYGREFPLQRAEDGQRIPTLAALFQRVRELGADAVQFDIETKIDPTAPERSLAPEPFVQALLAVIREAGMTRRVMVQSFDWRTLALLHRLEPQIRTMYLTIQTRVSDRISGGVWTAGHQVQDHQGSVPRMVRAAAGQASGVVWAPHFSNLTPELVREAQGLGLQVIPWTVNERPQMERLIDWGVDGIISDYPDRLRASMHYKGLPLPQGKAR